MMVPVLLALCIALTDALTAFPPKFLVGNRDQDVVVKCNTSRQEVTWTQNGEPEPMAELVTEGQTLTIRGLDQPATGNYSCWAGGVLLDSTYVVVGDSGEKGRNASCQADSYRGSFRCSWIGSHSTVFRAPPHTQRRLCWGLGASSQARQAIQRQLHGPLLLPLRRGAAPAAAALRGHLIHLLLQLLHLLLCP
ncbi:uncharacterized protein LOC101747944 isoform X2 [Gallus gallus]|uniref:uncharacterized protein LOC101747944 isoform X2 n=1 Tax=Gallus gallus TaxID=9031 RepID=UPI001F017364|nr:uncharacterized protein LOC101747944 isoform X2 [Gallus gallus]